MTNYMHVISKYPQAFHFEENGYHYVRLRASDLHVTGCGDTVDQAWQMAAQVVSDDPIYKDKTTTWKTSYTL
jgi:hypothetical protein